MEIKAIARRWGNSLAVVIPANIVEQQQIKENEEMTVKLEKRRPLAGELWGFGKGRFKKSTQEIKDDMRAGWLSDTDRKQEEEWKRKRKI